MNTGYTESDVASQQGKTIVITGANTGLVVLAFELAIQEMAWLFGVGNGGEGFESLPRWMVFAQPARGPSSLVFSILR